MPFAERHSRLVHRAGAQLSRCTGRPSGNAAAFSPHQRDGVQTTSDMPISGRGMRSRAEQQSAVHRHPRVIQPSTPHDRVRVGRSHARLGTPSSCQSGDCRIPLVLKPRVLAKRRVSGFCVFVFSKCMHTQILDAWCFCVFESGLGLESLRECIRMQG